MRLKLRKVHWKSWDYLRLSKVKLRRATSSNLELNRFEGSGNKSRKLLQITRKSHEIDGTWQNPFFVCLLGKTGWSLIIVCDHYLSSKWLHLLLSSFLFQLEAILFSSDQLFPRCKSKFDIWKKCSHDINYWNNPSVQRVMTIQWLIV